MISKLSRVTRLSRRDLDLHHGRRHRRGQRVGSRPTRRVRVPVVAGRADEVDTTVEEDPRLARRGDGERDRSRTSHPGRDSDHCRAAATSGASRLRLRHAPPGGRSTGREGAGCPRSARRCGRSGDASGCRDAADDRRRVVAKMRAHRIAFGVEEPGIERALDEARDAPAAR